MSRHLIQIVIFPKFVNRSFLYKDFCPNCELEHSGRPRYMLILFGAYSSWNCPHCGALIRFNYLLLLINSFIGLASVFITLSLLMNFTNIISYTAGHMVMAIVVLVGILFPFFATPRKLLREEK